MTVAAWAFAALFVGAAGANWWSRFAGARRVELWSKPLALVALIGVAVTIEPADDAVRAWFVVGLVLSLAGDVFLLDGDRWFVAGLGSFLLAHVAYTVGFVVAPDWLWEAALVAVVPVAVLGASLGRRIVTEAARSSSVLGPAVIAYLLAISTMFVAAAATGAPWAIVGAALFVASDTVLGWRQFVRESSWMGPTVMITYHLGQAGLVASLL